MGPVLLGEHSLCSELLRLKAGFCLLLPLGHGRRQESRQGRPSSPGGRRPHGGGARRGAGGQARAPYRAHEALGLASTQLTRPGSCPPRPQGCPSATSSFLPHFQQAGDPQAGPNSTPQAEGQSFARSEIPLNGPYSQGQVPTTCPRARARQLLCLCHLPGITRDPRGWVFTFCNQ